jgi:hypothetical protein
MPMIVMANPIEAAINNGRNAISAARPTKNARNGSENAARPTRATGARAMARIIIIRRPSTDTRAMVPARPSHRPTSPNRMIGQPRFLHQSPNEM